MDSLLSLPLDEVAKKLTRPKTGKKENAGGASKLRGRQRQPLRGGRRLRIRRGKPTITLPQNDIQDPSKFVDMTLDNYAKVRVKAKPQAMKTKRVFKTALKRGRAFRGTGVNLALWRTTLNTFSGLQERKGRRGGRRAREKMQKLELHRQQQAIIPMRKVFTPRAFGPLRSIALQPGRRQRGGRRKAVRMKEMPVIKNFAKRVRRQRVRKPKSAITRSPEPLEARAFGAKQWSNSNASSQRLKRQRHSPVRRELSPFPPPPRRAVKTQEKSSTQRFYMHDTQRWKETREDHSNVAKSAAFRRDTDTRQRPQKERSVQRSAKKKSGISYPTVKVSNVPTEYSRNDILGAFRYHLKVRDVIMKSRGTAFVLFHEMADARYAKEQFDGGEMNEHKIKVSWAENVVV